MKRTAKRTMKEQQQIDRVIAILRMHRADLEKCKLWPRLANLIRSGFDPRH